MAGKFAAAAIVVVCLALSLLLGCSQQNQQELLNEEFFNYTVHFCSEENCIRFISGRLQAAKLSVSCAFYGADAQLINSIPETAAAEVVVDEKAKSAAASYGGLIIHRAKSRGIMHNKYCVIDNAIVVTGSFNPTAAAANDYNNVIVINSTALADFYNRDFQRLKAADSKKTPTAAAVANNKHKPKTAMLNKTAVEVYFCPEDDCMEAVKRKLRKANSSILFAAYSFTSTEIANELILKKSEGVAVAGIIEKSTTGSKYSKHAMLAANGISINIESSKKLMHHKFFIIDNRTVITGSFNPTENAAYRNDENIIIIEDAAVAEKYVAEFHRIANTA